MAAKRARVGKKQYAFVKWIIALCVVVVLGTVFAASVGVGRWLLRMAEQYPAEQPKPSVTIPEQDIVPVNVPHIKAHAYELGGRYSSYTNAGVTHVCAPLRAPDGTLAFDSSVCRRMGWDENGRTDLIENVRDLHENDLYLCAYIPVRGFAEQDVAMRELTLSYEAALIAEAAEAGVDEIFLTDLDPSQANVAEIAQYLRRVKALAGDAAIGVLIDPAVLLAGRNDAFTAAQLLSVCDFLVLDLRGLTPYPPVLMPDLESTSAEQTEQETEPPVTQAMSISTLMEQAQYELVRYSPRLALSVEQTDALDYVIAKGYGNWVIMGQESNPE